MAEGAENPEDYDFDLPEGLVAQEPPEARGGERSDARLAVVRRGTDQVEHRVFRDIGVYFEPSDVLVVNNARVVSTLLHGEDQDGRVVAVSIYSPHVDGTWYCLVAPDAVCRPGARFRLGPDGQVTGRLLAEADPGVWQIVLDPGDGDTLYRLAEPIYPGYLKQVPADWEYYQTAYGSRPGAVLFPSAGRHFTPALLEELRTRGVAVAEVTLLLAARSHYFVRQLFRQRVAAGGVGDIDAEDRVDRASSIQGIDFPRAERYEVTAETAETINQRRSRGGQIVVCGTSALRTLETVADKDGQIPAPRQTCPNGCRPAPSCCTVAAIWVICGPTTRSCGNRSSGPSLGTGSSNSRSRCTSVTLPLSTGRGRSSTHTPIWCCCCATTAVCW
jgi:S-adenosylmethionine:tRNA ribosyltransferase-isomerase